MCTLKDKNRGSITIEMCFVMPIVVAVVMMLIMLIMRGLNEGNALGTAQSMVYEYSDFNEGGKISDLPVTDIEQLKKTIMLDQVTGNFDIREDSISLGVGSLEADSLHSISSMGCCRERNKCTGRLRRWQLYGNVLCD